MPYHVATVLFFSFSARLLAGDPSVQFTAQDSFLPPMTGIVVVKSGEPGPTAPKHAAVASTTKYGESLKLPGQGPYDFWWQPKSGIPVRFLAGWKAKEGKEEILKLQDYLGVVTIRGDDLPRAELVTIADQFDPGPEDKKHVPVQTAKEYRVSMVVPEGFYSLWITPDNGAHPRKVNDRFRILAGKSVTLE